MNRLKKDLIKTSEIGRFPKKSIKKYKDLDNENGVTRLEGTHENKLLRDYAVLCMKEAGLIVRVDSIGNIFGRKIGTKTDRGAILCGSHLDSVKNGGMFDGTLGVFAAIESVRRMNDERYKNERPIDVVVYTAEEGSAFGVNLIGSSVLIGKMRYEEVLEKLTFRDKTLGEALTNIGYKGNFIRKLADVEYSIELHIEQGPVLDKENIPIGIVENICGISWINIAIIGIKNHAGTTPMEMRKDALVVAAEIVTFVNDLAIKMKKNKSASIVGTVGRLNVYPNGTNIIPGKVELSIDIRDVVEENIEKFKNEIFKYTVKLGKKYKVKAIIDVPFTHSPIHLSKEVIGIIESVSNDLKIRSKKMNSGAGHDSQNMAKVVKTGMIFVPSINGISHAPLEWTNWKDIDTGVTVLEETLKRLSLMKNNL
jgi:hydantoinase/carbamoylase family amidase